MVGATSQSILIIESYHQGHPWDKSYIKGIKENIAQGYNLLTYEMDTKRIPPSEFEKAAQKACHEFKL